MSDIIKLTLIAAAMILLLRRKLSIGYVMLIASALLAFFYTMSFNSIASAVSAALTGSITIKLAFSLALIRVFELILREKNVMSDMMNASKSLLRKKKAVIVSMPLLIGLLPSVGGAYFSAPMVDESTKGMKMSPEEKSFINYWFRHPWEYILPLYPGILLASAISNIELWNLILANSTYAISIVITGFVFSMKGEKGEFQKAGDVSGKGLMSFMPILTVLLPVVVLHIELHYVLLFVIIALFILYGFTIMDMGRALKHGFSLDVIVLIIGIMLFRETMESSGAVRNLSGFLTREGIPFAPLVFLLPFVTGLLTGLTVGFVGSTFPLILSIAKEPSIGVITFAFASGFLGVLFSPVHICLVLTREYFKADIWGVYKKMLPACLAVFLVAVAEYIILK